MDAKRKPLHVTGKSKTARDLLIITIDAQGQVETSISALYTLLDTRSTKPALFRHSLKEPRQPYQSVLSKRMYRNSKFCALFSFHNWAAVTNSIACP